MIFTLDAIKKFILEFVEKYKVEQDNIPIDDENASENGSNEIVECFEYVIYPQKIINITQRANNSFSHSNLEAWDIGDIDGDAQEAFAPCMVKVLAKPLSYANTVLFGSCDELGNPKEVMVESGETRVLTFAFTHDNDIDDIEIGRIFKSGEKIYDEGKAGYATGNHIHLEVANGWQYEKMRDEFGHYRIKNIVPIGAIFHQLKGWNEIKRANGYTFKEVDKRGNCL